MVQDTGLSIRKMWVRIPYALHVGISRKSSNSICCISIDYSGCKVADRKILSMESIAGLLLAILICAGVSLLAAWLLSKM
jgi:hypothetical protein